MMEAMKIINQTATDMTITHPSRTQTFVGAALLVIGAALFIAFAAIPPHFALISWLALAAFAAGIAVLFLNTLVTIDLDKASGEIRLKGGMADGGTSVHRVADVARVAIEQEGNANAEAFLVFTDGSRIRIDHAHRAAALPSEGGTVPAVPQDSIASRVARFLGVPVEDHATS